MNEGRISRNLRRVTTTTDVVTVELRSEEAAMYLAEKVRSEYAAITDRHQLTDCRLGDPVVLQFTAEEVGP